jgi:AbiJ N-terminal domain 4
MPVIDLYSKRRKRLAKGTMPDVYIYDELPQTLRVQVIHIWKDTIGPYFSVDRFGISIPPASNRHWDTIAGLIARERGVFWIGERDSDSYAQCQQHLLTGSVDDALDLIEVSFQHIDRIVRKQHGGDDQESRVKQTPDAGIAELNERFLEHGIGYQYAEGVMIRIDSQYLHSEVVQPALSLLMDSKFKGPADEFLGAHEHYRHGRYEECISEALKAFESVLKAICDRKKWTYSVGATAKPLLDIVFREGLIPADFQSHVGSLRATLEAGLPTLRNRAGGHGQGDIVRQVPPYYAAYALHLSATNIVFLIEAYKASK